MQNSVPKGVGGMVAVLGSEIEIIKKTVKKTIPKLLFELIFISFI